MNTLILNSFKNAVESVFGKSITAWVIVDLATPYFNNTENTSMLEINSAITCAPKLFFKIMKEEVERLEAKRAPQSSDDCANYIHCAMEYAADETIKTIEFWYSESK